MKKFLSVFIMIFILLSIIGCSNKAYEEAIKKGLDEIENEEYARAEVYFGEALEEKEDDEKAKQLLKQTQDIQEAIKKLDEEGDLEAATKAAEDVMNVENGSGLLVTKAEEIMDQINKLKESHEKYTESYESASKKANEQKFDDAIQEIEDVLQQDLSHPYYEELKQNFESLKEEVTQAKEKAKAEAEAKKKAEEERKRKEAEEREKKEKEAAAKDMGAMKGYWLSEQGDMACHITNNYYACAVRQSDVMFQDEITDIQTINNTEKKVTTKDGYTSTFILLEQNVLQTESELLYRASKDEANAIYDGYYELP